MKIRRPSARLSSLVLAGLLSATLHLAAQQPSPTTPTAASSPAYDVVSIHPNKSGSDSMRVGGADGFNATNVDLTTLLMNAYPIRPALMSGLPGWADSTRFDVNAKVSDPDPEALKKLTVDQHRAMLIALLADRFHLKAHIEVKTGPVYDLVLAKGGPKLKEYAPPSSPDGDSEHSKMGPGSMVLNDGQLTAVGVTTSNLAANLAFQVERNVIDKTGLTGRYDIDLKWTPAELEGKPSGLTDNNAPGLFTALQEQLGLKLEPSKGPVDTLVVDHVEMPTAN